MPGHRAAGGDEGDQRPGARRRDLQTYVVGMGEDTAFISTGPLSAALINSAHECHTQSDLTDAGCLLQFDGAGNTTNNFLSSRIHLMMVDTIGEVSRFFQVKVSCLILTTTILRLENLSYKYTL